LTVSADIYYHLHMGTAITKESLQASGVGVFFRPRDIKPLGVSFRQLQSLVSKGVVQDLESGLYRLSEVQPTELETVAMVASAVPNAIVCLLSALRVHEIGTQSPHEVWIALDRKSRKPTRLPTKVRIVRFSGAMLTYGVIRQSMLGVPVSITSPARTVIDCFRYRNKVGIDVAMEALRDVVRSRKATMDEISRAAEVCRVRTVMKTYLEALSA
jgi:predicted transcriptional regulator of viral defense system